MSVTCNVGLTYAQLTLKNSLHYYEEYITFLNSRINQLLEIRRRSFHSGEEKGSFFCVARRDEKGRQTGESVLKVSECTDSLCTPGIPLRTRRIMTEHTGVCFGRGRIFIRSPFSFVCTNESPTSVHPSSRRFVAMRIPSRRFPTRRDVVPDARREISMLFQREARKGEAIVVCFGLIPRLIRIASLYHATIPRMILIKIRIIINIAITVIINTVIIVIY